MRGFLLAMFLAILCCAPPAITGRPAQSHVPGPHSELSLRTILQQLDLNAQSFRSLTADVTRIKVTVIVNDRSAETGKIWVRGENMRLEITSPDVRTILRRGDKLYIFTSGLKRVEEYDLGKHRDMVDQFLQLGFGTSGSALQKPYLVTWLADTTLDNRKVAWLELTPKSDEVRKQFTKIQLWVDENSWLPVEQKFFETGSDDYFEVHYSNMERNPKIDDSRFKPDWPAGTKKFTPPVG
jgi:outer membrane lipoprotein-sorting protein